MRRILGSRSCGETFCQRHIDGRRGLRGEIEFDANAGRKLNAFQHAGEGGLVWRERTAIIAGGALEDEQKAAGAAVEFIKGALVGESRIGMIDPCQSLPRGGARANDDGLGVAAAGRERLYRDAVIGRADQPFERRAFENGLNDPAPIFACCRWKIGRQGQVFRIGHRRKMP